MEPSVGQPVDIAARNAVGAALPSLVFLLHGWIGLMPIKPFATAVIGWCRTWAVPSSHTRPRA